MTEAIGKVKAVVLQYNTIQYLFIGRTILVIAYIFGLDIDLNCDYYHTHTKRTMKTKTVITIHI